jgi:hypothetical protein
MITITNGEYASYQHPDNFIEVLNNVIQESYPIKDNVSIKICTRMLNYEGTEEPTGQIAHRVIVRYPDAYHSKGFVEFIFEEGVYQNLEPLVAIEEALVVYRKQVDCTHELDYSLDEYGNRYSDGRAKCNKCNVEYDRGMPLIENRRIISMSSGPDISSKYDWGEASLQGGGRGIVLSKKGNYRTAFVEAFPTIDGYSTFIRGQGETVSDAEDSCWKKYTKMIECEGHDWERERTDGYAKCNNCGMKATVLKPSTKCFICEEPTINEFEEKHMCYSHFYNYNIDELLADEIKGMNEFSSSTSDECITYEFLLRYELEKYWLELLGKDKFTEHKRRVDTCVNYFSIYFRRNVLGQRGLKELDHYPEMNDEVVRKAISYYKDNTELLIPFIKGETNKLSTVYLIDKKHLM